jgi:exoribonuclease R
VEEFMLLANVAVAEQIVKFFPAFSLLRRHTPPKAKQFQVLIDLIAKHGFKFNIENSSALSQSLNSCKKDVC